MEAFPFSGSEELPRVPVESKLQFTYKEIQISSAARLTPFFNAIW
jgi:hypothetical protein